METASSSPSIIHRDLVIGVQFLSVSMRSTCLVIVFLVLVSVNRAGEDDMSLEDAVKDETRQTYYQGYLESMVAAVSRFAPVMCSCKDVGVWSFSSLVKLFCFGFKRLLRFEGRMVY